MNKKLQNLLTSSKFMLTCAILSIAFMFISSVPYMVIEEYQYYRFDILYKIVQASFLVILLLSYKKAEKGIQKALLSGIIFYEFAEALYNLVGFIMEILNNEIDQYTIYNFSFMLAYCIFFGMVFVGHLLLQTDGEYKIKPIKLITIGVCLSLLLVIGDTVRYVCEYELSLLSLYVLNNFGIMFMMLTLLCIETKVQVYKEIRQEALINGEWSSEVRAEAKKIFKL